ncbi:XRE family transcriptional regulator [Vibrio coralliilyticus]|uniref:XRE family transcriptional regulator n=1 Tax=Vibrio coralliilyticus TaxID=190893 RepID=UPI0020A5720E|nr:XRE family transcriptional regulator [Vibrio coralliilyticus]
MSQKYSQILSGIVFVTGLYLVTKVKPKFPLSAMLIVDAHLKSGLDAKTFIERNELNISEATLIQWESGQVQVPADVLEKLGLATEVTL